jgi:hypothetical protein
LHALNALHAAEHADDARQALFDLAVAEERAARPAATLLGEVLADADREGCVYRSDVPARFGGSGEPGTDARGFISLMLIFAAHEGRRRFSARWYRSWVSAADRTCFLDHRNTWDDVQGPGLHLTTYSVERIGLDRQEARRVRRG